MSTETLSTLEITNPGTGEPGGRLLHRLLREVGGQVEPAAVVAAAAVGRLRVVELVAQEPHAATVGVEVVEHRPLLAGAGLRHARVAVGVVVPRLAGGLPAAADPAYGAVDVEHLQHLLEAAAAEVDQGLQGGGAGHPLLGEHPQRVTHLVLAGNASEAK